MKRLALGLVLIFNFFSHESRADIQSAIWESDVIEQMEKSGLHLDDVFPTPSAAKQDLKKNPFYLALVDHLKNDLTAIQKADPKLSVTMATSHRLFNIEWLGSSNSFFELTAIVNRIDRRPFHNEPSCGELRLVYRLAYTVKDKGHDIHSRLPLTLNMVFLIPNQDGTACLDSVNNWENFLGSPQEERVNAKKVLGISSANLKTIEINMQSVRWPSTTRGDLGAHAEYLLRVFKIKNQRLELVNLENTPDVVRINASPVLKKELLAWIKTNMEAINNGVAVAPEKFLTKKATSVSPRGLTRISNRPWSNIFKATDFASIDFESLSYIKSSEALLRRLDDSSCVGCHQNRSVAGFHLLGVDRKGTSAFNSLAVPGSPHFMNDLERRSKFLQAIKNKEKPELFRPMSERALTEKGDYGAHCGLGDPGFASWTCSSGFICRSFGLEADDKTVGQCFTAGTLSAVGEPCEIGTMIPNLNPHKDKVRQTQERACSNQGMCEVNYVGFPEGMCAEACSSKSKHMKCGSIALLVEFNNCLGKGEPFTKCLAENTRPAGLRACAPELPCRDDYICAGRSTETGTCIPPYFLFQMRVDGHPKPK
jgi:hypothetical protein